MRKFLWLMAWLAVTVSAATAAPTWRVLRVVCSSIDAKVVADESLAEVGSQALPEIAGRVVGSCRAEMTLDELLDVLKRGHCLRRYMQTLVSDDVKLTTIVPGDSVKIIGEQTFSFAMLPETVKLFWRQHQGEYDLLLVSLPAQVERRGVVCQTNDWQSNGEPWLFWVMSRQDEMTVAHECLQWWRKQERF